jgi:outer membrane receptor for ferrienterochelin and colicin
MIFKKAIPILFICSILFFSCASSNNSSTTKSESSETVEDISMLDIMRKSSGVMVRGTGNDAKVTVRMKNFYNDEVGEPLFLLNGTNYASDFQSVQNSINPETVKLVEVYKTPAELSRYGAAGEHGVINIILK